MTAEIENILTDLGFVKEDNVFSKTEKKVVGCTIVNNEVRDEVRNVNIQIEYIGDGWIGNNETDNKPTAGYKLMFNGQDVGDVWVESAKDFKQFFGIN